MAPKAFHALFGRIGERAKMQFPIHPHMLRHGCGYALCRSRHPGPAGLARPQEHPAHNALHRAGAGQVQRLLAVGPARGRSRSLHPTSRKGRRSWRAASCSTTCRRRRSRDGPAASPPIQNVSGLSQGLAGHLAAGWRRGVVALGINGTTHQSRHWLDGSKIIVAARLWPDPVSLVSAKNLSLSFEKRPPRCSTSWATLSQLKLRTLLRLFFFFDVVRG
jgi:hypothetical protein